MLVLIEFFHLLVADDEGVTYVSQEGVSALKTAVSVSQVLPDVMEARGGGC
jgi:serine kinase of HPr protein (carbohydrate metabolism regulator)